MFVLSIGQNKRLIDRLIDRSIGIKYYAVYKRLIDRLIELVVEPRRMYLPGYPTLLVCQITICASSTSCRYYIRLPLFLYRIIFYTIVGRETYNYTDFVSSDITLWCNTSSEYLISGSICLVVAM